MQLRRGCRGAWIALLAAAADRLSKAAVARLAPEGGPLIPGLLRLTPVENRGAAFSMLSGHGLTLSLLTAALICGLAGWLIARPDAPGPERAGFWLIVGGGLSNLFDRLTLGGVSDFLEVTFARFAVFNVADVCICLGAALAVIGALAAEVNSGEKHGSKSRH